MDSISNMYKKHAHLMELSGDEYFGHVNDCVIELVPLSSSRVLEVGCAEGKTLGAIKEKFRKAGKEVEVVGVEIESSAVSKAKEILDDAICMNAEEDAFDQYPEEYFDVIIIQFVLEHVVNPWSFVRKWLKYLKVGGYMIIGVPNASNYRFLLKLAVQNDFQHEPNGILDWTHLRYFTNVSINRLQTNAGLEIEKWGNDWMPRRNRALYRFLPFCKHFFPISYTTLAKKVAKVEADDYVPYLDRYTF